MDPVRFDQLAPLIKGGGRVRFDHRSQSARDFPRSLRSCIVARYPAIGKPMIVKTTHPAVGNRCEKV